MDIKKEQRLAPTFVNLKSNTMKKSHGKCKRSTYSFQIILLYLFLF